ncbi:hypothetical protein V8F20_007343 [Naviculisporaceae sp. PSN 640]
MKERARHREKLHMGVPIGGRAVDRRFCMEWHGMAWHGPFFCILLFFEGCLSVCLSVCLSGWLGLVNMVWDGISGWTFIGVFFPTFFILCSWVHLYTIIIIIVIITIIIIIS